MNIHEKYIYRCIELAKNGLGTTYPNPMVGSVIVYNETIIGEGWHKKAGEPHAEVMAINAVQDKSLLSKATIYVSLEPCSHYGKTPPCADLIIESNIPNVVVGTIDPFAKVAGNGIKKLTDAGKQVIFGVLEKECNQLNKRFFTFHTQKRPYIILKWAESSDGFIAPLKKEKQEPFWLSNTFSRQLVHKWRSEEEAILVGTKTVLEDNPKLNTRNWKGRNPTRIILDKSGKIDGTFHVKDQSVKTIVITEEENLETFDHHIVENCIFDTLLANKIVNILYKHQIQSVIIEGGRQTLQTFIEANLWDEARVFKSNLILCNGTESPIIESKKVTSQNILDDKLLTYFNYD